jgi:hypothetical protein
MTQGWANSFVLHCAEEIIQTKSVFQQEQRWQVAREFLQGTVQDLDEGVQG